MTAGTVGLNVDFADHLLNTLRSTSYSAPAFYVMLHTGIPGADGTTSISAGNASLKLVGLNTAAGGAISNSASPIWTNGGTTETLTHISVWDGSTGPGTDNPLFSAALTTPQSWASGDTYTLDDLGLAFTPLMTDPGS